MGNPEKVIHIGRSGAGQICKVCNQVAIGGALAGVSEAFALAKKAGVDAARVRQALLGGFAASRVLEVHGERMLVDNYKPGFRARLYQKDMRLANETAAANGVSMPANAVVAQLLNALIASGGGDLDYAALGTVLFKLAEMADVGEHHRRLDLTHRESSNTSRAARSSRVDRRRGSRAFRRSRSPRPHRPRCRSAPAAR